MSLPKDDIFALILDAGKDALHVGERLEASTTRRDAFPTDWQPLNEGRLAVDVYDAGESILVLAPMAGVDPQKVEIYLHEDMLSIRGERSAPPLTEFTHGQYHAECYWGPFSRSIVMPADVLAGAAMAEYRHGLLSIRIPKMTRATRRAIPIEIVEE